MSNWDIEEAVKTIENRSTELYTALEEHDYLLSGLVKLTENCDKEIFTVSKLRTVAKQEGNLGNISSLRREEVETYMDAITAVTEDEVKKIDNYTPYDPGFKINLEAENAAKIDAAVKGKMLKIMWRSGLRIYSKKIIWKEPVKHLNSWNILIRLISRSLF